MFIAFNAGVPMKHMPEFPNPSRDYDSTETFGWNSDGTQPKPCMQLFTNRVKYKPIFNSTQREPKALC